MLSDRWVAHTPTAGEHDGGEDRLLRAAHAVYIPLARGLGDGWGACFRNGR